MALKQPRVITNILRILTGLWRQRYLIVVPAILMPLLAVVISIKTKQQWSTYTTILVQESAKMNPFLEDLSISTNLQKRIKTLDTLLHSRHMLLNVGYDLGLITKGDSGLKRENFVQKLSSALTVQLIGNDLIKISYRNDKPSKIDQVLSAVSERFLERVLAPELATLEASEAFLKEQLDQRRVELQKAELKLARFKDKNSEALPGLIGTNTYRLRDLKKMLESKRISLSGAEAAKLSIRTRLAQVDPVMNQLEQEISLVKADVALFKTRYTNKHSKMITAQKKLSRLEEELSKQAKRNLNMDDHDLERLWEIASSTNQNSGEKHQLLISQLKELQLAEGKVQQISQEIVSIERQVTEFEKNVQNYGDVEREMFDLQRDLEVKRTLYDELLERYEKASVTGALGRFEQPERIKIIDAPYIPSEPDNLSIIIYLIAGLISGIAFGLGLAFLAETADTTLRYVDDLSSITGVPLVARLPAIVKAGEK